MIAKREHARNDPPKPVSHKYLHKNSLRLHLKTVWVRRSHNYTFSISRVFARINYGLICWWLFIMLRNINLLIFVGEAWRFISDLRTVREGGSRRRCLHCRCLAWLLMFPGTVINLTEVFSLRRQKPPPQSPLA